MASWYIFSNTTGTISSGRKTGNSFQSNPVICFYDLTANAIFPGKSGCLVFPKGLLKQEEALEIAKNRDEIWT